MPTVCKELMACKETYFWNKDFKRDKVYIEEGVKVIAGLLVKTDYLSDNEVLVNKINPLLGTSKKLLLIKK